jgi:CHAD domain-containing protein
VRDDQADALAHAEQLLRERRSRIASEITDLDEQLAMLSNDLRNAADRIDDWKLSEQGFSAIAGGLEQTYARGCDALDELDVDAADEAWHEWRKRVKYHWYHTRLLQSVWKPMMNVRRSELSRLADLLGDDHDLAVLTDLMDSEPDLFGTPVQQESLRELIAERRKVLKQRALDLGERLYAEHPSELCHRMKRWWRLWRKGR